MMAGDRQFTHNGGMKMLGKTKIYEIPESSAMSIFDTKRVFVGFCGNADNFATAVGWLHLPEGKPPKVKDIEMLLLNDKGQIFHATNLVNWMRICSPFYSIGSGMHFAQAAMAAGKDPYEAVKIASTLDPSTGMKFNKLEMK
jgi:hypothetical protein